ncbi:hypothetical protein [Aureivirga sp. CE67]|uniref:hypothetical protein n=1 Tax=Aureivirga sp. CE67 TaxID=1788983 RepID=UPI0018CB3ED2|nr:hypothetical protein [Aureivirga sp. CE67]
MKKIDLQNKTKAEKGLIEMFYFENKEMGLEKTLFHRIVIPLTPFDSGIKEVKQPEETEIVIDWLELNKDNPLDLDNITIKTSFDDETETTISLGGTHNPCDIKEVTLSKIGENLYKIKGELFVDFEFEHIGKNENFSFEAELDFDTEIEEEQ